MDDLVVDPRVLVAWDSARLLESDLPKTADFLESALGLRRGPPWMLGRLSADGGVGELFSVHADDAATAEARFHAFEGMRFVPPCDAAFIAGHKKLA
jgi:hypothetical protein